MALDNTTDSTYINVLWLDIKNLQKSATRETFHVKRGERVDWTRLFCDVFTSRAAARSYGAIQRVCHSIISISTTNSLNSPLGYFSLFLFGRRFYNIVIIALFLFWLGRRFSDFHCYSWEDSFLPPFSYLIYNAFLPTAPCQLQLATAQQWGIGR